MYHVGGDIMDLVFVRFVFRQEKNKDGDGEEPPVVYCASESMGSLQSGMYFSSVLVFWLLRVLFFLG